MIRSIQSRCSWVRILMVIFVYHLSAVVVFSQQKFSPEKYQADMEQYITNEAGLTQKEAAAFFPLLREMQEKQRAIYNQMRTEGKNKPADEKDCMKAIQKRDQMELELKSIQQQYHNKFFGVLPASKVFDVLKAEDHFHRKMFRNWGKGSGAGDNHHPKPVKK